MSTILVPGTRSRMCRWLTALPLLAAGACSVVPEARFPPYAEYQIEADYVFAQAGEHYVPVPHSDGSVTVLALQTEPQELPEMFADGCRFLMVPPGCDHLTDHCCYRDYAQDGKGIRRPEALFPGARVLRVAP